MDMDIKDLLFFALVSLTVGLLANHYFNLNIGFLNSIESSLASSGQGGKSPARDTDGRGAEDPKLTTADCKNLMKAHVDRKTIARTDIATAKKSGDVSRVREIEAMLEALAREEKAVCK
jgi:hypothetical protein